MCEPNGSINIMSKRTTISEWQNDRNLNTESQSLKKSKYTEKKSNVYGFRIKWFHEIFKCTIY